jgi:hypothetical protein
VGDIGAVGVVAAAGEVTRPVDGGGDGGVVAEYDVVEAQNELEVGLGDGDARNADLFA